jgi:hypothetical protein
MLKCILRNKNVKLTFTKPHLTLNQNIVKKSHEPKEIFTTLGI